MIATIARGLTLTALAVCALFAAVLWRRREELHSTWQDQGVQVIRTDGTPRGDTSGAPFGIGSHVRSRTGVVDGVRTAPPPWEPAMLTALANWQPSAPSTPLARTLGIAWAAPMSAAGLLVGLLGRGRPRIRDGVVLFTAVGGPAAAFLSRRRFTAATWGHVVLCRSAHPTDRLMQHELVHTRQAERFGPFMPLLYMGLMPVYGYSRHPMERAARLTPRPEGPAPHPWARGGDYEGGKR